MSSSEMCPDCPIGGRDGSGPVCPHTAACDRQCAELVEACGVRCGLRRDLMEVDTPSPLETIRQRWVQATPGPWHVAPQATWWQVKAADPLETLAEPSRIEDAIAIAHAPADAAWLLAEVERRQSELDGYRAAFEGMVDVLQARLSVSPSIPIPLQNALAVLASRWEAHGAENFTSEDFEWTGADGVARSFRVIVQRIDGESPAAMVAELREEVERLRAALIATEHEVCQTLGAALGYPHDPEGPGICVGDHVAGSLAMEAAERIRGLKLSRG